MWTVLAVAMGLGFIVASVVYQQGGWLFVESDWFLIDHLSERPFLSKVICPHSHDAGMYQARELSHVLEFIDAHFIYWSVTRKMPHFYSVTNFALLFALSLAFWRNITKYLNTDPVIGLLLLGMFWTTPCIFLSGVYMRAAKQGAAVVLFLLVWLIVRKSARHARTESGGAGAAADGLGFKVSLWGQTFLLGLMLCWMDRQGFFLAAVIVVSVVAFGVGPHLPHRAVYLTALLAALGVHSVYNYEIGPVLIRRLTGFEVSFEYQKLPLGELRPEHLWQGTMLLLDNFRYFFGNVTRGLAVFLLGGMIWLYARARAPSLPPRNGRLSLESKGFFGLLLILWLVLIIVMNTLMVLRHEALYWEELRAYSYWIPTTVLVLIAVTFAVHLFTQASLVPLRVSRLLLAAAMFSNLTSLPEHNLITRGGHMEGIIAGAPHLLSAIKAIYESPPGPVPVGTYDTAASSRYEDAAHLIKDPLIHPNVSADEFVNSSNFYNWLRSTRNLDFKQW